MTRIVRRDPKRGMQTMANGSEFDRLIAHCSHLLRIVKIDTAVLLHHRYMFREILAMIQDNPELPEASVVYGYLQRTYFAAATAAVRRLTDENHRSISLYRLIAEFRDGRNVLTRDGFLVLHHHMSADEVNQIFNEFALPDDQLMDPAALRLDQNLLLGQAHTVREFVDKEVAHADREHVLGPSQRPALATYGELDTAIDTIQRTLRKYDRLLSGAAPEDYNPPIGEEWKNLFRVRWLKG